MNIHSATHQLAIWMLLIQGRWSGWLNEIRVVTNYFTNNQNSRKRYCCVQGKANTRGTQYWRPEFYCLNLCTSIFCFCLCRIDLWITVFSLISTQIRGITHQPGLFLLYADKGFQRACRLRSAERISYETICDAQSNVSKPYLHSQPLLIQLFERWQQLNIVLPLTTSSLSFATLATNLGLVLRHSP
jgi:hypothetical protein